MKINSLLLIFIHRPRKYGTCPEIRQKINVIKLKKINIQNDKENKTHKNLHVTN